jgi:hypothetical protein
MQDQAAASAFEAEYIRQSLSLERSQRSLHCAAPDKNISASINAKKYMNPNMSIHSIPVTIPWATLPLVANVCSLVVR